MKPIKIYILLALTGTIMGCECATGQNGTATAQQAIFPKGQKGPSENFTGNAYNVSLMANDSVYNMVAGNVYFGPGARSNWH